mgnify:CR=1 FL=1
MSFSLDSMLNSSSGFGQTFGTGSLGSNASSSGSSALDQQFQLNFDKLLSAQQGLYAKQNLEKETGLPLDRSRIFGDFLGKEIQYTVGNEEEKKIGTVKELILTRNNGYILGLENGERVRIKLVLTKDEDAQRILESNKVEAGFYKLQLQQLINRTLNNSMMVPSDTESDSMMTSIMPNELSDQMSLKSFSPMDVAAQKEAVHYLDEVNATWHKGVVVDKKADDKLVLESGKILQVLFEKK